MAYDKPRARRDLGGGFHDDPYAKTLQKLGDIVSDLYMATDPSDVTRLWNSAQRLLQKTKADAERVANVVKTRRPGALSTLVKELTVAMNSPLAAATTVKPTPVVTKLENAEPPANEPDTEASMAAGDEETAGEASVAPDSTDSTTSPSSDQLKHAMKAFRKRLKLTKLDEESRLGNRAMTGGHKSAIVAIMAPREYPPAVWDELVRQGKLRSAGNGFLELGEHA